MKSEESGPAPSDIEILVVDDSLVQAEDLRYLLETEGYIVSVAHDGQRALEAMRIHKPTMVLSDIIMPVMDGYELCRQIQADEDLQDVPVILLTALSDPGEVIKSLEYGAHIFVTKPYSETSLLARIQDVIQDQGLQGTGDTGQGIQIFLAGQRYTVTSGRKQILGFLLATIDNALQQSREVERTNRELVKTQLELRTLNTELRQEIAEHEKTETALERSRMEWESTFAAISDWVCLLDKECRIMRTNRVAEEFVGRPATEIVGQVCCNVLHGTEKPVPDCPMQKMLHTRQRESMEFQMPDGDRWLSIAVDPVLDEGGNLVGAVHIVRDITEGKRSEQERERIEAELRQAQKMDAVGRLAGGIAHDFNNILTVIIGNAQLAMSDLEPHSLPHQDLQLVIQAARRSSDLTRQLLAFSREQIVEPRVINLNAVVTSQKKMIGRLIGEDIEIEFEPADDIWNIRIDPSQIDQIMTNLAVNARDAIAGVGTITIETANVTLDDTFSHLAFDVVPGDYVMIAVSDTGAGIDAETLEHIFEPFFTTKPVGEGTGLGLSMVYGIAKQNEGAVLVKSELGMGTTFKIYFPRFRGEAEEIAEGAAEQSLTGTETVLVVEDEEQIANLAERILGQFGYTVLTATAPGDACALVEEYDGVIHLLLSDVVMPTMNGKELQARIVEMKPGIKTLFMSGYTANVIAQRGVIDQGVNFIQKPFSTVSLAKKVREVLDS